MSRLLANLCSVAALSCQALVPLWSQTPPERKVTYHQDVAKIVRERCASCHRPGQPVPFPLLTYEDVRKRARTIRSVLEAGLMPPWLPAKGIRFEGERRLTAQERQTLDTWFQTGMHEGMKPRVPAREPQTSRWKLGEPDHVVRMTPYDLRAGGPEVFRNFVLPAGTQRLRHVRAVELRMPQTTAVHHAILQVDRTRSARREDAKDEEAGFPGMDLAGSEPPGGHFLGWTPGKEPRPFPLDMGFTLHPGSDFVLQLHLRPTGKRERLAPEVGLHYGDAAPERSPHLITLFNESIDLAPGRAHQIVRDELRLPADVLVLSVYPHAHYLARSMKAFARKPNGERITLFDIPRWDFDWQDEYRYATPFVLERGTQLSFEYVFDNSASNPRNPNSPPKRVRFGSRSVDEMATLALQVLPKDAQARRNLEKLRFLHVLQKKPHDHDAFNELGILLAGEGRHEKAAELFRQGLAIAPHDADLHANLGRSLLDRGKLEEAHGAFTEALRRDSDHLLARLNLAELHRARGQVDRARKRLEEVLALDPANPTAHVRLGTLLGGAGQHEGALKHFLAALEVYPGDPVVQANVANAYFGSGDLGRAAVHYERALELRPKYFAARFNLARVHLAAGRRQEAQVHLEKARTLRPGHAETRRLLKELDGR